MCSCIDHWGFWTCVIILSRMRKWQWRSTKLQNTKNNLSSYSSEEKGKIRLRLNNGKLYEWSLRQSAILTAESDFSHLEMPYGQSADCYGKMKWSPVGSLVEGPLELPPDSCLLRVFLSFGSASSVHKIFGSSDSEVLFTLELFVLCLRRSPLFILLLFREIRLAKAFWLPGLNLKIELEFSSRYSLRNEDLHGVVIGFQVPCPSGLRSTLFLWSIQTPNTLD